VLPRLTDGSLFELLLVFLLHLNLSFLNMRVEERKKWRKQKETFYLGVGASVPAYPHAWW